VSIKKREEEKNNPIKNGNIEPMIEERQEELEPLPLMKSILTTSFALHML
jgi:hypothetical protein